MTPPQPSKDEVKPVSLASLQTLAEVNARPRQCLKGPSRAAEQAQKDKAGERAWEACKAIVWKRDGGKCRCCGRTVIKSLKPVPNRGEVHHLAPRSLEPGLVHDPRNCILVCLVPCHERLTHYTMWVTGPATAMFEYLGRKFFDATSKKLKFLKKESK